jgi:flagellar biogenesis protein FliO
MSPETAATKTTAGNYLVSAFLPFLLATILLFIVFAVVFWLLKNSGKMRSKGDFFSVLASQPVDRFSNIHLIRYLNEFYVIITTANNVRILQRIEEPESKEHLNLKYTHRKVSPFLSAFNKKVFEEELKKIDRLSE